MDVIDTKNKLNFPNILLSKNKNSNKLEVRVKALEKYKIKIDLSILIILSRLIRNLLFDSIINICVKLFLNQLIVCKLTTYRN